MAASCRTSQSIVTGRNRWVGTGRVAYVDGDAHGRFGVAICEVSDDAAGPPRPLAGFHPNLATGSFGVTADGSRVVLSVMSASRTLILAENVPGIDAVRHRPSPP